MPSLSATTARGINRTPLTPKIASVSRPPQAPSLAAAAATTPLPKRTQQRPATTTTTTTSSSSSNRSQQDDPTAASVPAFSPYLSSNITPRSGSRQNRVDSANSTPSGTPNPERCTDWELNNNFPFSSPLLEGEPGKRPMVTFNAGSPDRNGLTRQGVSITQESKFFHAGSAKTARPRSASKTAPLKSPTFFYANGNSIPSKSANPTALSPSLSPSPNLSQENVLSKFMYANGTPELRPTPPPLVSRTSGSTVSTASKGPTVRSAVGLQRPVSPSKLPLQSQAPIRNNTGTQNTTNRSQVSFPQALGPSPPGLGRPGTATSRSSGHSRSGSLVKGDGAADVMKPMASPTSGYFPPASLLPTKPPLTLASIIQAAEELSEHEPDPDTSYDEVPSGLQSPTKSTLSSAEPVTDLITNARRERKVQDLQIRNASLEAINRTLERQLRKQTAELRRYRRLSRSGRLSLASTTKSSRVPSETLSELDIESLGLSDLDEEDSDMEELDDESFSDTDSASSKLSPSVLAAQDAKHGQRDEQRLQLDLSKHQQLLLDSQKINQSMKRCLDWTEELIRDGKKALDYHVRASDVQLGGRVLDPLDEEDEQPRLLLSDDVIPLSAKLTEQVPSVSTSWGVEPQDRDSGIELPADGG
ncbi:hypothetical protein F5Y19DRAFT_468308 [Xylariaceae sp. FL1651]|nr:hypothetical protein F5Y19DRAFT_468308 [Xylariaceae sp. FL1651]